MPRDGEGELIFEVYGDEGVNNDQPILQFQVFVDAGITAEDLKRVRIRKEVTSVKQEGEQIELTPDV